MLSSTSRRFRKLGRPHGFLKDSCIFACLVSKLCFSGLFETEFLVLKDLFCNCTAPAVIDCGYVKIRAYSPKTDIGKGTHTLTLSLSLSLSLPPPPPPSLSLSFSLSLSHTHTHTHTHTHKSVVASHSVSHVPSESLLVVPVSQASAQQRAGRAGRVRSGREMFLYKNKKKKLTKFHLNAMGVTKSLNI